jgi:hypothetical protein
MIRLTEPPRRPRRGPVDAHGTPLREVEFFPDVAARREYLARVLLLLERKGFVGRAECVGRRRVHLFARHPYGLERSVTIDVASGGWAHSLSGAPSTPYDLAYQLMRLCRGRTP